MGPLNLARISCDALLHAQRRKAGAHGVILMRKRRAEQRHDAVAHYAVHSTLVTMHRFDHAVHHGMQYGPRILHVALDQDFHRSLNVGKEHGDLLALAFERRPSGQNLVDKMLRRVASRRRKRRIIGYRLERMAALRAEFGGGGNLTAAIATDARQRRSATCAALRFGRIVVSAIAALHLRSPERILTGRTAAPKPCFGSSRSNDLRPLPAIILILHEDAPCANTPICVSCGCRCDVCSYQDCSCMSQSTCRDSSGCQPSATLSDVGVVRASCLSFVISTNSPPNRSRNASAISKLSKHQRLISRSPICRRMPYLCTFLL